MTRNSPEEKSLSRRQLSGIQPQPDLQQLLSDLEGLSRLQAFQTHLIHEMQREIEKLQHPARSPSPSDVPQVP